MADLQKFDAEIEKTRQTVEEMKTKLEQSGIVLEKLAKSPNTKWVPFEALGTVGQSVAAFRNDPPTATPPLRR